MLVDNLKVYKESHQTLGSIKEMFGQASNNTGACYGAAKCAETERIKIVEGEYLQILNERMKTVDQDKNEIYKFLGVGQANKIKMKEMYNRAKEQISKRMNIITRTELNHKNLVRHIITKS